MLRNYATIALRFMIRQKGFSFINISGLTIGIAASLLIVLYIKDELSFDTFHPEAERIYRVNLDGRLQGKIIESIYSAAPLGPALQNECRAVESTLRLASWPTFPVRFENRSFTESRLILADSNFFSFFNFELIAGNPDSVLLGKRKVVITESAARRYFDYKGPGDRTPIGKKMYLAQDYVTYVSGIAKDPPANSHINFPLVLSLQSWDEALTDGWVASRVATYIKLKPESNVDDVKHSLEVFTSQYVNPALEALRKVNINQFESAGNYLRFSVIPLLKIHLHSNRADEIQVNNDAHYVYLFSCIGAFIILLACINFMNLSTARSAVRAKEVSVRKSVGAPVSRLIVQFLIESFFYVVVAVLIAFFIVLVLIGPFNVLTGKALTSSEMFAPSFIVGIVLFVLVIGLLAGSYPAFYLTHFTPIEVLRGRIQKQLRSFRVRNVLVVFQFFISTTLIIATLTVYVQLRFINDATLGFDKQNVINLLHTANLQSNGRVFKEKLLKIDGVVAASYCNRLPPNLDWQYVFRVSDSGKDYMLNVYEMDYDHFQTMKYAMVKGRFFSEDFPSDSSSVILNEAAARRLHFNRLDQQRLFTDYGSNRSPRDVIGILRDFNFRPLKDSIQPMAVVLSKEPNWEMAIRIHGEDRQKILRAIQALWEKYTLAPFEYTFLDQNFDEKHQTERKVALLFLLFTVLAIFIGCLGLYGLAAFISEQRTKEIGIRKVLGASPNSILVMLNADFFKLVLIATVLSWPVSWVLMTRWLEQFAYRISIPWWIFLSAGAVTVVIAFFSVSSHAMRTARENPLNALRNE